VRPAVPADEDVCNSLSRQVHGFDRAAELTEAVSGGTALVVERGDRVTGYTTHLGFLGHTTTETNLDMQALLASVESFAGPGVLVPSRNSVLLRWCLQNGLRVTQPMTLMSAGLYSDPAGAWLPSVTWRTPAPCRLTPNLPSGQAKPCDSPQIQRYLEAGMRSRLDRWLRVPTCSKTCPQVRPKLRGFARVDDSFGALWCA
jgi:hypothetical protein